MGDGESAAGPGWMISSTVPRAELYVSQSSSPSSTSW